jgi:large conductance mechanosensitive channel
MGFVSEFKEFAMRGNVVDLAIGVIIGGAFQKIVNSLIDDVITPLLLKPALEAANLTKLEDWRIMGAVKPGVFLSATINFIIVALVLFIFIKAINAAKSKLEKDEAAEPGSPPAPPAPSREEVLLGEIRDLLKRN